MNYMPTLGYEVHAISLPGHGNSSLLKGNINRYSFQDYLDCMGDEIAKLSSPPVLVGHSLGGYLAQKYIESNKLPGTVLLSSTPNSNLLPLFGKIMLRHPVHALRITFSQNLAFTKPEIARGMFLSPDNDMNLEDFAGYLCPDSIRLGMDIMVNIRIRPEKIKSPLLVIAGENDACFPVKVQQRLAARLGAEFIMLPGQAHDSMLEPGWKELADHINRWITDELELT